MSHTLPHQGHSVAETPREEKDIEVQPDRRETSDEWDQIPIPWIVKWTSLVAVIALPIGKYKYSLDLMPRRQLVQCVSRPTEKHIAEPAWNQ